MKKAIGTFDRCLSELDIKRRRLTVLSWMPPGGKTHEMRPSFTGTPDFLKISLGLPHASWRTGQRTAPRDWVSPRALQGWKDT